MCRERDPSIQEAYRPPASSCGRVRRRPLRARPARWLAVLWLGCLGLWGLATPYLTYRQLQTFDAESLIGTSTFIEFVCKRALSGAGYSLAALGVAQARPAGFYIAAVLVAAHLLLDAPRLSLHLANALWYPLTLGALWLARPGGSDTDTSR